MPQDPARGGILVVKTDDVAAFCQADPFVQRGVQRYDVIPFRVFDGPSRRQSLGGMREAPWKSGNGP